MDAYIEQAGLGQILAKVRNNERLSLDDGRLLYNHPNLMAVGYLANIVRERVNGNQAFFIYNQHINYSNICTNLCKFCAFGKEKGHAQAYEMSIETIKGKVLYGDRADGKLPEGRTYIQDLLGCLVIDADSGTAYGTIADVQNYGSCDIYDLNHFPQLREKYSALSVPCYFINDGPLMFGRKNLEQLVDLL